MKNLLLIIFLFLSSFVTSQCLHTIKLTDTFGDGWNGGAVSVSVNGVTVLNNITFTTGAGPVNFNFTASTGQTIRVWRTLAGSWPSEMRVQIVNNTGTILLNTIQPTTGTATSGGNTCIASCSVASPGCTNTSSYGSAVAPSTPTTVTISACNFQSEYSTVSGIVAGQTYQFGYSLGGYITVHTGTYNGPIVAYGNAPLNWSSSYTGTVFIHYNTNSSCGTLSSCGTSTVTCVTCSAPPPPANDLVCNATSITCGQVITGTTIDATNSGTGENGVCGISQTQPGVWYRVLGNGQIMTAYLCNTVWDSKISVFSGTSCSVLTCVGGNDDFGPSCATTSASYQWQSVNGLYYYILVHGYSSSSSFQLGLTCTTPPPPDPTSITTTSNTICVGQNVTLTANGVSGTVYWFTGGCGLGQIATGNSITVTPSSTTTYYARNFNGSLFSNGCVNTTITVNPAPSISINPVTNTICENSSTQLVTTVSGLPVGSTPTYTWTPSTGLTNPSAPSPYASPTTTQSYSLMVTFNGCSNSASTTINVNPSVGFVSTISGNNTIIAGTQETYSITPVANATYQWSYTESLTAPFWINIPNSNSPSTSFYWPQTTTDGSVRVTVSNSNNCGTQVRFMNIIVNGALPVELISFDGSCDSNKINLIWETATEYNSDYFEVLKSRDGQNWQSFVKVESSGNSNQKLTYTTQDINTTNGNNYYKLNQFDYDGKSKEYGPINVFCDDLKQDYFFVFPNPNSGEFQIILENKNLLGESEIIINDTRGLQIYNKKIDIKPGINTILIEESKKSSGLYYIYIRNRSLTTSVIKIEIW